ncbi:MAG: NLP/P60 family protein [Candidatus Wolfebacteria bacterium GW2011_GWE1_48_7]|uniref:NLP/P60 family protein n=2 Tax=Candidatus Wolfeibacteriota TaxID=1752735 RepID=A0A0G1X4S0_9BACT|nr:MAG: NLP/P60 family protein [Candidatus Wolfebacteria bacterium GW2011_GWB1_47_1]KKU36843.1 MAG: NLP/P60 family protein [Candidatus Wolfebacteria bacterium GW2011_GWC2_46_275]KKU42450.1 MAG: NLP/P60 family protein [Candidatus Wolfebacteria bacterium GW2011_GWB2_46_69]KKU54235.1 MAG: NLP/P60 family protein [Candidatus Wolfebacteria bacterium GW2011_GWC1_47_103]KKU59603.1 MAG: NLP/P60 family protein [Candidatus Wolfebacteria bacterium GW2011_GWE2_47_12]KKU66247.1 MAG: NLP/P60 family protein [
MERHIKSALIIKKAEQYLGLPYKYGAYRDAHIKTEPEGFDCSFFTYWVYKKALALELPLSSLAQASVAFRNNTEVQNLSDAKTGDLLFFKGDQGHYNESLFDNQRDIYIGHVGIYIQETGEVIHAQSKMGVIKEKLVDLQTRNPRAYQVTFIGNYY